MVSTHGSHMSQRPADTVHALQDDAELHGLSLANLSLLPAEPVGAGGSDTDDSSSGPPSPILPILPVSPEEGPPVLELLDAEAQSSGSETEYPDGDSPGSPAKEATQGSEPSDTAEPPRTTTQTKRTRDPLFDDSDDDDSAPAPASAPEPPPSVDEFDRGNAALQGWQVTASTVMKRLERIRSRFKAPDPPHEDNYMMNSNPNALLHRAVLMRILEELEVLAVETPLVAMLMTNTATYRGMRFLVHTIVDMTRKVAERYKKASRAQMKPVFKKLTETGKLMNIFENVSRDRDVVINRLKTQLKYLEYAIQAYVAATVEDEPLPSWWNSVVMSGSVTDLDRTNLATWKEKRWMRIMKAQHQAHANYLSISRLRDLLQRIEGLPQKRPKAGQAGPSNAPAPAAQQNVFEIDSDDDGKPAPPNVPVVDLPDADEESADSDSLLKELSDAELRIQYINTNYSVYESAYFALARMLSDPDKFDERDWMMVAKGIYAARSYDGRDWDAISAREARHVAGFLKLMERIVAYLTSRNEQARAWFEENEFDIPSEYLDRVQVEADNMQTDTSRLTPEQGVIVGRAVQAVLTIASSDSLRREEWLQISEALRFLNSPEVRGSGYHIGRLIGFFSRAIKVLKQRSPDTAKWYAENKDRFDEPPAPMDMGAHADDDIPEEIYASEWESDGSAD